MDKPEALRLAEQLEAIGLCGPVAAELRRLSAVEAQRDALLEALRKIAAIGNKMWGTDWEEIDEAREIARAAIKAVEGENT